MSDRKYLVTEVDLVRFEGLNSHGVTGHLDTLLLYNEVPSDAVVLTREQVEKVAEMYGDYVREKNSNRSNASDSYYKDYIATVDELFGEKPCSTKSQD